MLHFVSEAIAVVVLGAIFGGLIQVASAWSDRDREGRAAALVVYDVLSEALGKAHEPQLHPTQPVVVDFLAYTSTWEIERKALARTMPPRSYAAISEAFAELRTLGRKEALAHDLRDEVFDALLDASQRCEQARRIAWRHAQSRRARGLGQLRRRREDFRTWRGHRRVGRSVRDARKQSSRERKP